MKSRSAPVKEVHIRLIKFVELFDFFLYFYNLLEQIYYIKT